MKRFCLLLYLAFYSTLVFAQDVLYSSLEPFDLRTGDFAVVGRVDEKLYTYRATADGAFLEAFNDSMGKIASVVLDFFPTKIYQARFINYPDKIVVLYQALSTGKVVQYAALLDANGRLLRGPLQLTSAKTGLFGPDKNYFNALVSDNKKQIFIYSSENKGDEALVSGIWLDDQLENLQRSTVSFKADNRVDLGEGLIGNDGTVYLSAFTPTGASNYADEVWLLLLGRGRRLFTARSLPLNNLYATNLYMKMDEVNNSLYIGGFYSDKKNGQYEGLLYASYSIPDSNWSRRRNISLGENLRNASGQRNKKRAFNNYQVRQMIIRKDGGFVLIAENFYITTRTTGSGWGGFYYSSYYSPFPAQSIREYNYNDIFVVSYDAEGKYDWGSFIRKNQYSQEDGGLFSSFGLINTGGSLGFLFNNFNARRSGIELATVDGNGKTDIRSLDGENYPDWLPRSGKQTALKEMVIPCLQRRQLCFAKIVF